MATTLQYLSGLENIFVSQMGAMKQSKESLRLLEAVAGLQVGLGTARSVSLGSPDKVIHKGKS